MDKIFASMDADTIIGWLTGVPEISVYLFLALSSVIENVFPPWPGDTVTVIGGFMVSKGSAQAVYAMLALVVGNLIGAYIMYFAGEGILAIARRYHDNLQRPQFLKNWLEELISEEGMKKTHDWFERWGVWFVLVSRFSAGIRFFVSIIAGISRMNLIVFSLVFTLGVLIWNTLLLWGGYMLGNEWERILDWLRVYNMVVIGLICIIAGLFFYFKKVRKKRENSPGDEKAGDSEAK